MNLKRIGNDHNSINKKTYRKKLLRQREGKISSLDIIETRGDGIRSNRSCSEKIRSVLNSTWKNIMLKIL